jgi:hypothetical protein
MATYYGKEGSMKALWKFIQIEMKEYDHDEDFFIFNARNMDVCKELNILWI